jgi:colanic acid biosynthesis glycosyl transferase WcaI
MMSKKVKRMPGGKRRIVFVVALFPPENEPTAVMAGELAREWARQGDKVTVICPFPNRPIGRTYPGFPRWPWRFGDHDGVRVLRVWTWLIGRRRRVVDRMLENLSFGVSAALAVLTTKRPDILLVESWPIVSQVLIMVAARLRGLQVINYIKDVYPEALVAAGVLSKGSRPTRFLGRLDAWLCRGAAVNITIGKGMTQLLAANRRLAHERFTIINDWIDLGAIGPFTGTRTWRKENGIRESDFVCMFAGTLGLASRADILVEVARAFDSTEQTRVVCIGEGVLKQDMERAAAADGMSSLVLLPFQPRQRLAEAQSSADVMLLTSSPEMGASSIPSKLITYLAVGKPVICSVAATSDIAHLVRDQQIGLVVEPGDPGAIVTAVRQMHAMKPSALAGMSRRARQLAVERFSLPAAMRRFDEVLDKVVVGETTAFAFLGSGGHNN